jgi:hypothetical protein
METAKEEIQKAAEAGFKMGEKILTMEDIEAATDISKKLVRVPEWNGSVWVFGMTSKERDDFEQTMIEIKGKNTTRNMANIRARLCARCIRTDSTGSKRMFKADNIEKLGQKSARAVDRIFTVAQRLSGMSSEDVDELAKN